MKNLTTTLLLLFPTLAMAQQGAWEVPVFDFGDTSHEPIVAVHLIHVFDGTTGKILALTQELTHVPNNLAPRNRLWTPDVGPGNPGSYESVPYCCTDLFCGGHCALGDGRILLAGGNYTQDMNSHPTTRASLFDPTRSIFPLSNQWNELETAVPPDMNYPRFYPTLTTLGDGRVLVFSGTREDIPPAPPLRASTPELYGPSPTAPHPMIWIPLTSATRVQPEYPAMFLLPDGNLLDTGIGAAGNGESRILRSSNWTWGPVLPDPMSPLPTPPIPPGEAGSAVMYAPGKVMKCGGKNINDFTQPVGTTFVVDLNNADPDNPPSWVAAKNMNLPRRTHNLVVLPDGKVLALGGNTDPYHNDPVRDAEIFDPVAGSWILQPASDSFNPRMEHSTAMLLADGRVVSAGGDGHPTAQIFRPPYIISGAKRPIIAGYPSSISYGLPYNIQYSRNGGIAVTKACLMRLGAVTHGFDQNQRRVPLTITSSGPINPTLDEITVAAPANGNIAPPGDYMLFILVEYSLNEFAPCEMAAYVQVGP